MLHVEYTCLQIYGMIGSEGRLAFPYQRVGMVTALQELSSSLEGKYLSKISPEICKFLLSCYKDDGRSLNCSLLSSCSPIYLD